MQQQGNMGVWQATAIPYQLGRLVTCFSSPNAQGEQHLDDCESCSFAVLYSSHTVALPGLLNDSLMSRKIQALPSTSRTFDRRVRTLRSVLAQHMGSILCTCHIALGHGDAGSPALRRHTAQRAICLAEDHPPAQEQTHLQLPPAGTASHELRATCRGCIAGWYRRYPRGQSRACTQLELNHGCVSMQA